MPIIQHICSFNTPTHICKIFLYKAHGRWSRHVQNRRKLIMDMVWPREEKHHQTDHLFMPLKLAMKNLCNLKKIWNSWYLHAQNSSGIASGYKILLCSTWSTKSRQGLFSLPYKLGKTSNDFTCTSLESLWNFQNSERDTYGTIHRKIMMRRNAGYGIASKAQ